MFELRPYQRQALDALDAYWKSGGGNPLLSLATATGKALLIAWLIRDSLTRYPHLRILSLVHVQELIEQNVKHLLALWPEAPLGVNCAAFGQRDWDEQIVFASIQSVFRSPARLGRRDLVLIDEVHLVPHAGEGMYRTLLEQLRGIVSDMRVCGLTATPYRLDSGRLDEGDGKVFDRVVYEYGIAQGIRDGWLSPLSSKATQTTIDVREVGRRGGEFIPGALEAAADVDAITNAACDEIVALGSNRRAWLVFCVGINHATHVRDALRDRGIGCETVFGETSQSERERIIAAFRAGEVRCLVNVMVLTTGFDVPHIDMLVMLRPTLSTGLYVQMVGRGTRKAEGKQDCLILDFAQNVYRHGPVDRVSINVNDRPNVVAVKPETVQAKVCPECQELVALQVYECPVCAYEWERPRPKAEHATTASAFSILSTDLTWLPVSSVSFFKHRKAGNPSAAPTLRVEYLCELNAFREFIALEHRGPARQFAERWWFALGGSAPVPATVEAALTCASAQLDKVLAIAVVRNGDYWNVAERLVRRPNGNFVEIDRNYRCWTKNSRAVAAAALRHLPIDDAIPY